MDNRILKLVTSSLQRDSKQSKVERLFRSDNTVIYSNSNGTVNYFRNLIIFIFGLASRRTVNELNSTSGLDEILEIQT
jgi:hypothetical protein